MKTKAGNMLSYKGMLILSRLLFLINDLGWIMRRLELQIVEPQTTDLGLVWDLDCNLDFFLSVTSNSSPMWSLLQPLTPHSRSTYEWIKTLRVLALSVLTCWPLRMCGVAALQQWLHGTTGVRSQQHSVALRVMKSLCTSRLYPFTARVYLHWTFQMIIIRRNLLHTVLPCAMYYLATIQMVMVFKTISRWFRHSKFINN